MMPRYLYQATVLRAWRLTSVTTRYVHVVLGGAWPVIPILSMHVKKDAYILVGEEIMNIHTCLYNNVS